MQFTSYTLEISAMLLTASEILAGPLGNGYRYGSDSPQFHTHDGNDPYGNSYGNHYDGNQYGYPTQYGGKYNHQFINQDHSENDNGLRGSLHSVTGGGSGSEDGLGGILGGDSSLGGLVGPSSGGGAENL